MASQIAYVGSTNNLELNGLKTELEGLVLNGAVVSVTIKDTDGNPVPGEAWPQNMQYVNGSEGNYVLGLTRFLGIENGKKYIAYIDADASDTSAERYAHWEFSFTGKTRTS